MLARGRNDAPRRGRVVIRRELSHSHGTIWKNSQKFSLHGGPLCRLGRRLGLVRGETNTLPLGLAIGLSAWSILLALALLEGVGGSLFSLSTIAGSVRLLGGVDEFAIEDRLGIPRRNQA